MATGFALSVVVVSRALPEAAPGSQHDSSEAVDFMALVLSLFGFVGTTVIVLFSQRFGGERICCRCVMKDESNSKVMDIECMCEPCRTLVRRKEAQKTAQAEAEARELEQRRVTEEKARREERERAARVVEEARQREKERVDREMKEAQDRTQAAAQAAAKEARRREEEQKEEKRVEAEQAARRAVSPPLISVDMSVTAQPQ